MLITGSSGAGMNPPCNPDKRNELTEPSLAMVYAPKQYWRMLYSPEEAMARGTLFEELDKPILTAGGIGK